MWLRFYIIQKLEYLSSIVFQTAILKILKKRQKSRNVASLLYRGQLRYYIEDKVGEFIIDGIPHSHTENAWKRGKNQETRNVASLLYRERLISYIEDRVGVCIIDSIPHCHTKNLSKEAKIKKCGFVSI